MLLMLSLNACSNESGDKSLGFDFSVDVPSRGWTAQDTLFYPIHITEQPEVRTPLLRDVDYDVFASIRMSSAYKFCNVPMTMLLQQTDTTGGMTHVVRNLLRQEISPIVRNDEGRELGANWGSLTQHEVQLDSISMRFDSIGTYRILLIPTTQEINALDGIFSVGLSLRQR